MDVTSVSSTMLYTTALNASYNTSDANSTTGDGERCLYPPMAFVILSQVASLSIGIFGFIMMISLSIHFLREASGRYLKRKSWRSSASANPRTLKRKEKFVKKIMNFQMISAASCITIRCTLDFYILQAGYIRNPYYVAISIVEILLNIMALSNMYLVLWLRQWSFYNHPAMDDEKFKKLRLVCALLLVVMVATGIWNAVAFLLDREIKLDARGCIVSHNESPWSKYKFYILGACTLFYQAVLLFLFAYPLAHHAKQNRMNEYKRRKSILRVLKRVFIAAVICCVTDLFTTAVSVLLEAEIPESSFIVYNFNILSNFLCLLYTFGDWRLRVFYLCIGFKDSYPKTWMTTMTSHSNGNHEGHAHTDINKSSTT